MDKINKSKLYMPDFSSPKAECRNCGREMSGHDYLSGQFICLASTREAMKEILDTIAECEKRWKFDRDHGFLTSAEIEAARKEFDK